MQNIFFALERVYKMTYIPVRLIDKTSQITFFNMGYAPEQDPIICDEKLRESIVSSMNENSQPLLMFEDQFLYGLCHNSMGSIAILGPISTIDPVNKDVDAYKKRHNIHAQDFFIKRRKMDEICASLAIIYFVSSGKKITEADILFQNKNDIHKNMGFEHYNLVEFELDYAEEEAQRYNFSTEMQFVQHIKDGNSDALTKLTHALPSYQKHHVGKLAENSFKQNEYLACTIIILASRAAIEGGLDSLTAYLLSDAFLQKLEKCATVGEIYILTNEVAITYAERVKEAKEGRSKTSYVEQCKSYISNNLRHHFTIDDVAEVIGINKSYLSRIFSKEVGIGIQKYTYAKRIDAAASMLKYSDVSILEIANFLCFTSQSHMGSLFKKQLGVTPQKYRDIHKIIDF